ncbi:MAG TPA: hypothetical protein DCM14_04315 [Clostridiales bacterium UBA8153]|nr:hypothetical protein [Clostridiales bacterium UBA8153]
MDRAVDEYLMGREYKEFIRPLRYFIEMQESRIEAVHVLVSSNGICRLIDKENQPLPSDHLDEGIIQLMEGDMGYEDLPVSSLITLAPRLVTIHMGAATQKPPSLETLISILPNACQSARGASCAPADGWKRAARPSGPKSDRRSHVPGLCVPYAWPSCR